jgi:hypothetical protein
VAFGLLETFRDDYLTRIAGIKGSVVEDLTHVTLRAVRRSPNIRGRISCSGLASISAWASL